MRRFWSCSPRSTTSRSIRTSLSTLERDPTRTPNRADAAKGVDAALLEFYKKLRPGDPPTLDNAKSFMQNLIFAPRRYDLGKVGRYKLNRRLDLTVPLAHRTLTNEDLVAVVRSMIQINNGVEGEDDIDHLGNRRVKTVGELIQNQLRIGLLRMERVVRERMSHPRSRADHAAVPDQHPPGGGGDPRVLRRLAAQPVHGSDQSAGRADPQAPPRAPWGRAVCAASAPASMCATCTTATTAASARSRRRKARTSA